MTENEKIVKTTTAALKLARKPFNPNKTTYGEYEAIYMAPTGNVKDAMAPFKNAKRVLAVGGIGAFGFEAAINDAEKVDMFDCNELQRCFFELVRTAMKMLDYDDFMLYFTLKTQNPMMTCYDFRNLLSPEMFMRLEDFLPYDVRFMYGMLYDNFEAIDLIYSALYRYCHAMYREYLTRFASMYDREKYYKLQATLRNNSCDVTYTKVSLIDLPKRFEGPYNLIVLGNILQYYDTIPGLSSAYDVNKFIKKELSKLLAPDGTIQVNYGFEIATQCLKMHLGIPYPKNQFNITPMGRMILKAKMKTDINVALVKKGGYDYTFFEGVETFEGHSAENCILTYTPSKQK